MKTETSKVQDMMQTKDLHLLDTKEEVPGALIERRMIELRLETKEKWATREWKRTMITTMEVEVTEDPEDLVQDTRDDFNSKKSEIIFIS